MDWHRLQGSPVCRCVVGWALVLLLAVDAGAIEAQDRTGRGAVGDPVTKVNVFTGTSNSRWMQFPGATLPMGLVKMSPDNQGNVWDGGYEYTVASVAGFGFLHTIGLSSMSVMPLTGSLENEPGQWKLFAGPSDGPFGRMWTSGYRSRMNKTTEVGSPGYYAVDLIDAHTRMELTAMERTGWMRYTPNGGEANHLVIEFGQPVEEQARLVGISVERTGANELAGRLTQTNQYAGEFTVYFVMQLSGGVVAMGSWENGDLSGAETNYGTEWRRPRMVQKNVSSFESKRSGGVWLDLDEKHTGPIVIRTGISLVGAAEARRNLQAESAAYGFDFDRVRAAAAETWRKLLSRVEVEGGSADDQVKLYTNLYRAYTGKAMLDDVEGTYRDACGAVQTVPRKGEHMYSSDALWGAQWTLGPLWSLVTPELLESFDRALLLQADRGGWLPDGTVNMRYAPIMDAHHEMAMIAGAWQKGLRGFDGEAASAAMHKVLTSPAVPYTCGGSYPGGIAGDRHMAEYMRVGYVPEEDGPASSTFEYAYDDACAATLDKALGHGEEAQRFRLRSGNWKNSMDPASGYAQRRYADGRWVEPNDLLRFGTTGGWSGPGFMEGNAWLYSWFVPQDVNGLVAAMGRDRFNARLEEGFVQRHVDLTNEPNLQAPWLFNYSGKAYLTQKYARAAFAETFDTSPLNGWPGEEDEGQMGAYVVLAGMGLFDMEGGCTEVPHYQISGPAFERVTLHLGAKPFVIIAHHNSASNVYIQSARLNGQLLGRLEVAHRDVVRGGTLVLEMGPAPAPAAGLR